MYLDVKVRLPNNFWARHLADTDAMWLMCNSTLPFRADSRLPGSNPDCDMGIRHRQVGNSYLIRLWKSSPSSDQNPATSFWNYTWSKSLLYTPYWHRPLIACDAGRAANTAKTADTTRSHRGA